MTKMKRIKMLAAVLTLLILGLDTFAYATGNKAPDPGHGPEMTQSNTPQPSEPGEESGSMSAETTDKELTVAGEGFTESALPEEVKSRMAGKSYPKDAGIDMGELRYVQVLYIDFDGRTRQGEMVVNRLVAKEVLEIFRMLYDQKYPIAKMVLIDDYNGDDNASMADNNTSAFCWREIAGGGGISEHAAGLAIDVNPLLNPYLKEDAAGNQSVLPEGGEAYLDRNASEPGLIVKGDDCYTAFISHGWLWGGDWTTMKDYQHFYKPSK